MIPDSKVYMKKPFLIIGSLLSLILILSVVQVTLVNGIATGGVELANIQQKVKANKLQNQLLKEEYLQLSSLTNIDKKAKAIGFVQAKTQVNLTAPLPLAKR